MIKQNVRVRKVLEIKWKQTGMSGESEEETINLIDICVNIIINRKIINEEKR